MHNAKRMPSLIPLNSVQFPFRFLMGNSVPQRLSGQVTGKVILSNGTVFTYSNSLTVAELMLEHPQEVVVEFDPATVNDKKPSPLPADHALNTHKLYLMVPVRRGGKPATLSSEQTRQILTRTTSVLKTKPLVSYTGVVPLFLRICPGVGVQHAAVLPEKKDRIESGGAAGSDCFAEILEGRPEFLSRQISGKGWKPSLDPIKEKTIRAKSRHWMF